MTVNEIVKMTSDQLIAEFEKRGFRVEFRPQSPAMCAIKGHVSGAIWYGVGLTKGKALRQAAIEYALDSVTCL